MLNIKNTLRIGNKQLAICILLTTCLLFNEASAQVLGLDSILKKVEQNNPLLESYKSSIEAYTEKAKGAKSLDAPTLQTGLDNIPYDFKSSSPTFRISGQQMFTNPKKLGARKSYLESLSAIETNEAGFTKNQLRAEAKRLYYERLVNEKSLKVLEENSKLMEIMLNLATTKYTYEEANLGSIYKMKAALSELKIKQLRMQNMIQMSTTGLNYLMGIKDNPPFAIDTLVNLKMYRNYVNDALNLPLLENRSDVQKMSNTINSMKLNQTLISTQKKPDFGIMYEHMGRFGKPDLFYISGKMTIPIAPWSAKGYKHSQKSIDFEIEAMQKERENMINMASRMVNENLYHIRIENQILDDYQNKVIPDLKKGFDISLAAYEQNTGQLLAVIDVWESLNRMQMEYLEHLQETLLLVVDYEREIEK